MRALHTLTGSAQTVNAQAIVAVVQPLQKAALAKQRDAEIFDRLQCEYIGELVTVLRHRLDAMENGTPIGAAIVAVESRLQSFVQQAIASKADSSSNAADNTPGIASNTATGTASGTASGNTSGNTSLDAMVSPGLAAVFEQEARDLITAMRLDAALLDHTVNSIDARNRLLSNLHTLKGSARMAGQSTLADKAHIMEAQLQDGDIAMRSRAIAEQGVGELQQILSMQVPVDAKPLAPDDSHSLSDATFERLLALATDASV